MADDAGRVALRLTDKDARFLRCVANHLQSRRRSPFVTPADAVRAALEIAAGAIARDGLSDGHAPHGA